MADGITNKNLQCENSYKISEIRLFFTTKHLLVTKADIDTSDIELEKLEA